MKKDDLTYVFICFSALAYEFNLSDKTKIEEKIKRKLKYYNFDSYNQEIVNNIRVLRNELYEEISLRTNSKYFIKSNSKYSSLEDFDIDKIETDYQKKYNNLSKEELLKILNFAVYIFYLR